MKQAFFDWIGSIPLPSRAEVSLKLQNSIFLTFNYTLVLEETYGFPEDRMWHIRGKASHMNKECIIFTHNLKPDVQLPYKEEDFSIQETEGIINSFLKRLYKDIPGK